MANLRQCVSIIIVALLASTLTAGILGPVAPPGTGPMPGIASSISVAFSATDGFAIWRVGFSDVWGVPLDLGGRPTGPARLIVDDPRGTEGPVVQWIDGAYVAWWGNGYPSLTQTVRVNPNGLMGEVPKTLEARVTPAAWNDEVTVAFGNADNGVRVSFYDRARNLIRSAPLTGVGVTFLTRALALPDGSFAVVTSGWDGLYLSRFSPDGTTVGSPLLIEASRGTTATDYRPLRAAIASDGDTLLVAWTAAAYGEMPQLKSVTIDAANVMSPPRTLVKDRWKSITAIEATWSGGSYTLAVTAGQWDGQATDDLDIYAARLGRNGEMTSGDFIAVVVRPGLERALTMVHSGGSDQLFFHVGDYGMEELYEVSLPASGSLTRPDPAAVDALVSQSAAWQGSAVAASDGTGWLAVWMERLANREEIRSVLLSPEGMPAGPPATLASQFRYLGQPRIVFNGIDYVVSWNEGAGIVARRIRTDGKLVDATPILISGGGTSAMGARDGLTLVTWSSGAIYAAVLHADGRVSAPVLVSPMPRDEGTESIVYESPVVSAGDSTFLVAWSERRTSFCTGIPCPTSTQAQARLVTRALVPSSPVISFAVPAPYLAAAAGGTHLLTFNDGRAVLVDEATAQSSAILTFTDGLFSATPFSIGDEYVLAYRRNATSPVLVRRISPDGTRGPVQSMMALGYPAAVNTSGAFLLFSTTFFPGPPYFGVPAVVAEVIDTLGPPPAERRRAIRR